MNSANIEGSVLSVLRYPVKSMMGEELSFVEPPRKGHPKPPVWIMLPHGTNITSDQHNANAVLSRYFESS